MAGKPKRDEVLLTRGAEQDHDFLTIPLCYPYLLIAPIYCYSSKRRVFANDTRPPPPNQALTKKSRGPGQARCFP